MMSSILAFSFRSAVCPPHQGCGDFWDQRRGEGAIGTKQGEDAEFCRFDGKAIAGRFTAPTYCLLT
jgi:hypothetical protein